MSSRLEPDQEEGLLLAGSRALQGSGRGMSYGQLVWRRFLRNRLGVLGGVAVAIILLVTIFADFLSPYDPTRRGAGDNINNPPQALHFMRPDGSFSIRPFVHPTVSDFDLTTFEITQGPDRETVCELRFFAEGWRYRFLGMEFNRHLFLPEEGCEANLLGTDSLGRDILSRMLRGAQPTLLMAGIVVLSIVVIGTTAGVISGYFGGRVDLVIQRTAEFALSLPDLPLYLAIAAILPRTTDPLSNFLLLAAILSALRWAQLAREVRAKTLSIKTLDYVQAAESLGASRLRIVFIHIMPNVMSHVIIVTSIMIPTIILVESFLSFLGLGIRPPLVSWGLMLNDAQDFQSIGSYPWLLSPVFMILVAVLAFNALGDGLRDALDPHASLR